MGLYNIPMKYSDIKAQILNDFESLQNILTESKLFFTSRSQENGAKFTRSLSTSYPYTFPNHFYFNKSRSFSQSFKPSDRISIEFENKADFSVDSYFDGEEGIIFLGDENSTRFGTRSVFLLMNGCISVITNGFQMNIYDRGEDEAQIEMRESVRVLDRTRQMYIHYEVDPQSLRAIPVGIDVEINPHETQRVDKYSNTGVGLWAYLGKDEMEGNMFTNTFFMDVLNNEFHILDKGDELVKAFDVIKPLRVKNLLRLAMCPRNIVATNYFTSDSLEPSFERFIYELKDIEVREGVPGEFFAELRNPLQNLRSRSLSSYWELQLGTNPETE